MKKNFAAISTLSIIIFVGLGFLNAKTSNNAAGFEWYNTLMKAPLSPPNFLFAIAWSILYILIALSFSFLLSTRDEEIFILKRANFKLSVFIFIGQFIINLLWSYLFWTFRNPFWALIDIILLDILVLLLLFNIVKVSKTSFFLLLPYMCWLFFATYLNFYVVLYN